MKSFKKYFLFLTAFTFMNSNNQDIIIRPAQKDDFDQILNMSLNAFSNSYDFKTEEQVNNLKKIYDVLFVEEVDSLANNNLGMVALVATAKEKIVGYISYNKTDTENEYYMRWLAVDVDFQKKNVATSLLKFCRNLMGPKLKRIICCTNKKNIKAQNIYLQFSGKTTQDNKWALFLYKNIDASNFMGFEFNQEAIMKFDAKFKS